MIFDSFLDCRISYGSSKHVDSNASLSVTMPAKRKSSGGGDKGSKEKAARVTDETLQEQPYIPKCVAWFPACNGKGHVGECKSLLSFRLLSCFRLNDKVFAQGGPDAYLSSIYNDQVWWCYQHVKPRKHHVCQAKMLDFAQWLNNFAPVDPRPSGWTIL